ncbi:hypothetical protein BDDG_12250 [Blastomyces dermatitidis ATCC 18188]|uniref:Uncharacterized protein n=1 Tax=Ajellomyces dermatitidis (strain ATCC 18188 / CBS 674.68) TaxID=653446 RepID=A0A0J9ENQ8_AJEDA|nr:hypothetical protein BDDG_12250 [Blastomyces dermatitidis ATCC 18188]
MSIHKLKFTVLKAHYDTHYATKSEEICTYCLCVAEFELLHKCIVSDVRKACDNCHFHDLICYAILRESYVIVKYYIRRLQKVMCHKFYHSYTLKSFVEEGSQIVVSADHNVGLHNTSHFFNEELSMGFPLCPANPVDFEESKPNLAHTTDKVLNDYDFKVSESMMIMKAQLLSNLELPFEDNQHVNPDTAGQWNCFLT